MLRSCQRLPLLRDPLLGFPLRELLDEAHMVTDSSLRARDGWVPCLEKRGR